MITLTPNRRLAASLAKLSQREMLITNQKCWSTPVILPFATWLQNLWREYSLQYFSSLPLVLNGTEENIIWEYVITQTEESTHLMQIAETADLAKSAWGLLKQYEIPLTHAKLTLTTDSAVFLKWALAFQTFCQKTNCIDQQSLTDFLIEKISDQSIVIAKDITLYGFTEISPQYKKLLLACESQGVKINYTHTKNPATSIHRMQFSDKESEIRNMALHAKKIYEENPLKRVACIIPNLEDNRETVLRIFSTVFQEAQVFNISAGKSLATYPVIRLALMLLSLPEETISLEKFSQLLHSPFLGEAETEMIARASFVNQLYRANRASFTLKELLATQTKPALADAAPKLFTRLSVYDQTQTKSKLTASEYISYVQTCLKQLGWPGERSTNSEEHQAITRFLNLLNDFKKLDNLIPPQYTKKNLRYLERIIRNDVFQPESPETTIQVLGILEAAETPFDHIWMMGMDDLTWPPAPKPNPFIPLYLQKNLSMPHASSEREYHFCETIQEQLINSAHEIIFSSALQNEETELKPSPLIEKFAEQASSFTSMDEKKSQPAFRLFQYKNIETIVDFIGPTVLEPEKISGGTKIFELQAACPFKAFAECRLYAKPTDNLSQGLRPQERGVIVHHILEIIWGALQDSKTLKSLPHDELNGIIQHATQLALKKYQEQHKEKIRYLDLETIRLTKIISDWLALEKNRPDFVVVAKELQYHFAVGKITVTIRIDRIDEIEDKGKLIIDYKTGKNIDIKNCFGERPLALQLPLYCIIDPENTVGIAYAKIHPEDLQLEGISKTNLDIRSIKTLAEVKYSDATMWGEQIKSWQQSLHQLSEDFCNGIAHVDPKENEITCEHCQLKPFCRVHEC